MAEVQVGARRVSYRCPVALGVEAARGETVLMVHGACDNGDYWRHAYAELGTEHTPIAIDLPGRRSSQGPPLESAEGYRAFLQALVAALALPPLVFCGHSMGGSMAVDFAAHHPERVRALVLVTSAPSWPLDAADTELWDTDVDAAYEANLDYLFSPRTTAAVRQGYDAQLRTTPPATCVADIATCDTFHLEDKLADIRAPALVLCGKDEVWIDGSRAFEKGLANATAKYVPAAGHAIMLEQPWAATVAIQRFLAGLG